MDGHDPQIIRDAIARKSWRAWEEQRRLAEHQRRNRQQKEAREEHDLGDLAQVVVLVTEDQIAEFSARLDRYDAALVDALHTNEQALESVRTQIDTLLTQAHTLPDGRRVFRSEDGQQVFDEDGNEVGPDVIAASDIDEGRPSWETYSGARLEEDQLLEEREDLFSYQNRLDAARDRLDDEDLTAQELEDLGTELETNMPAAVGEALNREDQPRPDQRVDASPEQAADGVDLDALGRSLGGMPFQPR